MAEQLAKAIYAHRSICPPPCIECDEFKNLAVELEAEVVRAKAKFPSHKNLGWALIEETGELAKALLHQESAGTIRKEAIQVMAVAYRIITEGDASLDVSVESQQK